MSELSIQQKRELLKKIARGDVKPQDLAPEEAAVEMWTEDESDPQYMRMFYPHQNQRMKKEEYERRAALVKQTRVTINIF